MTPEEVLAEVQARADAAQKPPWIALVSLRDDRFMHVLGTPTVEHVADYVDEHDAAFIAAARDDIPRLVAALNAVLALHGAGTSPTSEHYHCDPDSCDRAGEGTLEPWCDTCSEAYPCATRRAVTAHLIGETP